MSPADAEQFQIGELAKACGVTVRALHHYDDLGLLVPSERTYAGYRLYGAEDVRRLYRIVVLRGLGLSLAEISELLDGAGIELGDLLSRQLGALERQLSETRRLRDRLGAISDALARSDEPSLQSLIETMEALKVVERYYTPEQHEQLARRREQLGSDAIKDAERAWEELFAQLRVEMNAGTDPADPRLDGIRTRSAELVRAFTGGDASIGRSLGRVWSTEDPAKLSRGTVDSPLHAYFSKVCAVGAS
jgi:DNA-binding transcriptional MerR regulator